VKVHVSETRSGNLQVEMPARCWQNAAQAALFCRDNTPQGYDLAAAHIVERSKRGGQRCTLRLILRARPNSAPMEEEETIATLSHELALCGQDTSPPIAWPAPRPDPAET